MNCFRWPCYFTMSGCWKIFKHMGFDVPSSFAFEFWMQFLKTANAPRTTSTSVSLFWPSWSKAANCTSFLFIHSRRSRSLRFSPRSPEISFFLSAYARFFILFIVQPFLYLPSHHSLPVRKISSLYFFIQVVCSGFDSVTNAAGETDCSCYTSVIVEFYINRKTKLHLCLSSFIIFFHS